MRLTRETFGLPVLTLPPMFSVSGRAPLPANAFSTGFQRNIAPKSRATGDTPPS